MVAALGNDMRRDDGAGPAVLSRLPAELGADARALSSPVDLLGLWDGRRMAVIIDAVGPGHTPGEVSVTELLPGPRVDTAPNGPFRAGSHTLGLVDVLRASFALGSAPDRVLLVGIAGTDFGHGVGLSDPVAGAILPAARAVVELVRAAVPAPGLGSRCGQCR